MRGKVYAAVSMPDTVGITPAYAGKRFLQKVYAVRVQDHPRLCGEKIPHRNSRLSQAGSPPPMRGKGRFLPVACLSIGITPAYAGKSSSLWAL